MSYSELAEDFAKLSTKYLAQSAELEALRTKYEALLAKHEGRHNDICVTIEKYDELSTKYEALRTAAQDYVLDNHHEFHNKLVNLLEDQA